MAKRDARDIRAAFDRGENIMQGLRAGQAEPSNSPTAIAYSYDIQAGDYIRALSDPDMAALKHQQGKKLAEVLAAIQPASLLDAGTGEATSLVPLLEAMQVRPASTLAFDISVSRLLFARRHLNQNGLDATLFAGEIDRIPLADASVDVVLTVHAVEPNRGREDAILAELLRVAARCLVLVEPSYETAGPEARARMDRLGYVRGLPDTLTRLRSPPKSVARWDLDANPDNPAALIIVEKATGTRPAGVPEFVSPISGQSLISRPDCLFCPEDGHAFPIISGIPCLTVEAAILASKLGEF